MALSTLTRFSGKARFIFPKQRVIFICCYSSTIHASESPKSSKITWTPPSTEIGFYSAERDYSRDKRYSKPQKKGDTPMRFFLL